VAYEPVVRRSRRQVRSTAAVGGDQELWNGVPVRPISGVGASIDFDVAAPFRVSLGKIPKGAMVYGVDVIVKTVFNAGTTNVLVVGTIADPDALCEAGDVDEAAVGTTPVYHRTSGVVLAQDTEYFISFTQTGAAATTGRAVVALLWAIV